MSSKNVSIERTGHTALVTIDRPKALNALNRETMDELEAAFRAIREDDAIRGVILTGAGRAFVAGADVSEIATYSAIESKAFAHRGQEIFAGIESLTKPVIAAVNGFALGGGCELALACHIRVASEKAVFGLPEVTLGIMPGYGGTQRLPRIVGRGIATEIAVTGRKVAAEEAARIGLANKVVPPDELIDACQRILAQVYAVSPLSVAYVLDAIHNGLPMSLDEGCAYEAGLFGLACGSEDGAEGMGAFLEKRKAEFQGK